MSVCVCVCLCVYVRVYVCAYDSPVEGCGLCPCLSAVSAVVWSACVCVLFSLSLRLSSVLSLSPLASEPVAKLPLHTTHTHIRQCVFSNAQTLITSIINTYHGICICMSSMYLLLCALSSLCWVEPLCPWASLHTHSQLLTPSVKLHKHP